MTLIELRAEILIRLGSPVINIELDDTQMDLYISDTIDKFIEVHYDGLDEGYIFLDQVVDQNEYILPNNIFSVMEIMSMDNALFNDEPMLVNPFLVGNSSATYDSGMLDLTMFNQTIAQYNNMMKEQILFEFNKTTHILNILNASDTDSKVALKVHQSPTDVENLYNNTWVKKYSTALSQIAWAQNISKYEGATLPGGVSLNYQQILSEGKEMKEMLEEELYTKYSEPIDFFFG